VKIVLLPGTDGTGILFQPFVNVLPEGTDAEVVSYPGDEYLTYEQLADLVRNLVPRNLPYIIVAESYSGPVAALLAAAPTGRLQGVVFVASFVSGPFGRLGRWAANAVPVSSLRVGMPGWFLRWLLMDAATPSELIGVAQDAISRVSSRVLVQRLRDSLKAEYSDRIRNSKVRMACLAPQSDRLLGERGMRGLIAANPNIEILRIPGPHALLQCAPERCVAALGEWL
jgi:pimeloyl-ACP methyl ester carboxylesterase